MPNKQETKVYDQTLDGTRIRVSYSEFLAFLDIGGAAQDPNKENLPAELDMHREQAAELGFALVQAGMPHRRDEAKAYVNKLVQAGDSHVIGLVLHNVLGGLQAEEYSCAEAYALHVVLQKLLGFSKP